MCKLEIPAIMLGQGQLTIFADVPVDEIFQLPRNVTTFKFEAARYFLCHGVRDIFSAVYIGVEHHHTQRIVVLPPSDR